MALWKLMPLIADTSQYLVNRLCQQLNDPSLAGLDHLLRDLDYEADQRVRSAADDHAWHVSNGPFSVFCGISPKTTLETEAPGGHVATTSLDAADGIISGYDDLASWSDWPGIHLNSETNLNFEASVADQPDPYAEQALEGDDGTTPGTHLDFITGPGSSRDDRASGMQNHTLDIPQNLAATSHLGCLANSPLSKGSPYLPREVQFLMSHYVNHAVNSLALMPMDHAPWKGIHVPSALAAYGELDLFGKSSFARVSLLYSLLSLTCFHLGTLWSASDDNSSPASENSMGGAAGPHGEKWDTQGRKFRGIARTAFRKHMDSLSGPHKVKCKYKETLMAAMSLICVGVVSGDTWDSRYYILQCEEIVRNIGKRKERFSKKALALHRIFAYVRIIEQTTFCQSRNDYFDAIQDREMLPDELDLVRSVPSDEVTWSVVPAVERLSMSDLRLQGPEEDLAFANLYGIPSSLLQLLARTNTVIDELDRYQVDCTVLSSIPLDILQEVTALEHAICAWHFPAEGNTLASSNDNEENMIEEHTPNTSITNLATLDDFADFSLENNLEAHPSHQHQQPLGDSTPIHSMRLNMITAMHHAILVYFFRHARFTNPTILQHYVESVLRNLEALHSIKQSSFHNLGLGAIVWPAFIVACEAQTPGLRRRALACLGHTELTGFRNGKIAKSVVREIWHRSDVGGGSGGGNVGCSWRSVVRELRVPMLLT
ncbi:arginine metabolism regulation protein II [Knufia obscura]|uniref:Arginine metabolism regulation protein II n=1 Tax=Knufia obscura TaxID=1635080 RepID=A0ABR0RPP9_9EURO|nr:arginine metabolism regulation protein II [Knufia obscura]